MYRTVIFDLDGTLLDSLQDLAAAGNHALSAMGMPVHAVDAYRQFVGSGVPTLVRRMLPQNQQGEATQQLALQLFGNYYTAHMRDYTAPYPGVFALLQQLQAAGVRMAVASNKSHAYTCEIVQHFFPGLFAAVAGAQPGGPTKPDPAIVFALLEELAPPPGSALLYVGDSDVDVQTAHNAKLPVAGVTWGFRGREELAAAGADFLVDDTETLAALILGTV